MAQLDEDAIRERARQLAAQGATEKEVALLRRARAEIEREFNARTRDAGTYPHRVNPPLEVDEALDPDHAHRGEGKKWASDPDERGAG
jgi:hypothetical protein